jgi:hypothetical protein
MAEKDQVRRPKVRTNFVKVFVRYIGGRHNKIGFVAEYYKDIADLLVQRGHVEIITNPVEEARAKEDLKNAKENAIIPKPGEKKKDKESEEVAD